MSDAVAVVPNRAASRPAVYPFTNLLSIDRAERIRREIALCPHYAPTPLWRLPGAADEAGVAEVYYKDESTRFALKSFKALGGAYAVAVRLQELVTASLGRVVPLAELARREHAAITGKVTVTCASDGNHGRAVAAGAQVFGCQCVIFLHPGVSEARADAIRSFDAEVLRTPGTYDDSVRAAAEAADARGWELISDTVVPGHERAPLHVMQGYAVLVMELLEQLEGMGAAPPTHVFVQAGVGGLAAAVTAHLWEALGAAAPIIVVVEPDKAACLYRSAVAGRPTVAPGDLDTVMAGLACGEVSELAWRILSAGADGFMTVGDSAAVDVMRSLACGGYGARPIVAGESAAAGLAGLLALADRPAEREALHLDLRSRVLVIGTEGATDPTLYERLVGRSEAEVAEGARAAA